MLLVNFFRDTRWKARAHKLLTDLRRGHTLAELEKVKGQAVPLWRADIELLAEVLEQKAKDTADLMPVGRNTYWMLHDAMRCRVEVLDQSNTAGMVVLMPTEEMQFIVRALETAH